MSCCRLALPVLLVCIGYCLYAVFYKYPVVFILTHASRRRVSGSTVLSSALVLIYCMCPSFVYPGPPLVPILRNILDWLVHSVSVACFRCSFCPGPLFVALHVSPDGALFRACGTLLPRLPLRALPFSVPFLGWGSFRAPPLSHKWFSYVFEGSAIFVLLSSTCLCAPVSCLSCCMCSFLVSP